MLLLQGLLHAGAVLDSGVIGNISAEGVRTEFSGKVHGAWSLIRRAGEAPLRALNLFSSLAAFSGSGGQGSYAAANAALDAWAQALQACTALCKHTPQLCNFEYVLSTPDHQQATCAAKLSHPSDLSGWNGSCAAVFLSAPCSEPATAPATPETSVFTLWVQGIYKLDKSEKKG